NATAMIASHAPKEKNRWAVGTLSTGALAGTLIAPSIGGASAQWFGMENVFIITGVILFITTLLTIFLVKKEFQPVEKKHLLTTKGIF
ncbi:MFS transporter, partial [Enterococcus faecalis]|uniref:MFS transporter n=1 Tax=Enterococcus faecalis TaxID=1351 RepID=UPI003D6C3A37